MTLKLVSIGTKFGGTWMEAAKKNPNWEIAGCVARTEKSVKQAARKFKIEKKKLYTNVDIALDEIQNIDAVVVAVPNQYHYEIAKKVLNKGIHLILEKPITETWEQAIELVKLVDKNKVKSCVGQTLRGDLMFRLVNEKLKQNIIGDIEHMTFKCHWTWDGDPKKRWRFRLPNMYLDDIGIHQIDGIRMLLGNRKAKTVFAQTQTPKSYSQQNIKTTASAIITMEDDIMVNYFGSMGSKGESVGWYGDIEMFGSKGSLHKGAYGEPYVVYHNKKKKHGLDSDDIDKIVPMFDYEKIPYLLEDFYHAIKDDHTPLTDLHDNINSHAILLAMKLSAAESRSIDIQKEFPQIE